jgi:hypothetical protein
MDASLPPDPRLGQLQRWMQDCIMTPGPVSSVIPANDAPVLIRPSRTLAPLERLDIYRGMYELRLVEALRVDYPGLLHFLGEETFEELARLYVAACPSQSYTLNRLGDRLPDFLTQIDGIPRPRFVEALARLELAETLVFDEAESTAVTGQSIAGLTESQWESLHLTPIPALRLVRLSYPAHEYLQAMRREETPPSLRPRATRLIVYRREYGLFHLPLTAPAFALFQALIEGRPLGEAMEFLLEAGGASRKQLFEWFRQWFSEGLFSNVEVQ